MQGYQKPDNIMDFLYEIKLWGMEREAVAGLWLVARFKDSPHMLKIFHEKWINTYEYPDETCKEIIGNKRPPHDLLRALAECDDRRSRSRSRI